MSPARWWGAASSGLAMFIELSPRRYGRISIRRSLLATPATRRTGSRRAPVYWAVARLQWRREELALRFLEQAGHATYCPRRRERRVSHGRKVEARPLLLPGYTFVTIQSQWQAARWAIGVMGLIMDGARPARVPDTVIAEIRKRERGGLIELPKRPEPFRLGDQLRVTHGPLSGCYGLYAGQRANERIEVLLALLGRVTLPRRNVEAIAPRRAW
jgi:transcriptional antiterminator RfaH